MRWPRLLLLAAIAATADAATTITVSNTVVTSAVKPFGLQMSDHTYYDRIVLKNLVWHNAGFEALQYQTLIRCASGSPTGCVDDNPNTSWPTGFWDGGTYEFIFGTAKGRAGMVVTFVTAPHDGVTGSSYTFEAAGVAPAAGDYFIVRKYMPGGADTGWNPFTNNGATITTETSDLPPNTDGRQCIRLSASSGQFASINSSFGTYAGQAFVLINGTYRLTFKAKGAGGANSVAIAVARGATTFASQTISLSSSWATYNVDFSGAESGNPAGFVALQFNAAGSSVLIDDVSIVQTNGDPANTTAFGDSVIAALQTFNPGILRSPNKEQAEPLDNLIAAPFGKLRTGYTVYGTDTGIVQYGWQEFLDLCEYLHTEPYLILPMTFSNAEIANAIEYLGGPVTSPYGARRAARGHPAPWTDSFTRIHLEYGNESWNPVYRGATMFAADYGVRGNEVFGIVRQSPYYSSAKFNLILGVQAANPFNSRTTHNASANHDMLAIAPYMATRIDDFESNERLFGGLFAESSWWSDSIAPNNTGPVRQTYDFINATSRPVPLIVYEVNLHTTQGSITQPVLDSFTPSIGAGLAVADHMLIMLRDIKIRNQALFALAGYQYNRDDGKTVLIWGVTRDMGVTDRKRPQYLALKLANEAVGGDLVQTIQTGDDPHWDQPLTNRIEMNNVPYVQSFAFISGNRRSLILFNLHRTSDLQVTFDGANAPSGPVTMRRLSAIAITETNENAENAVIQTSSFDSFDPAQPLTLPAFSMTVLISGDLTPSTPANLVATALSASLVSLTWSTSQGATQYEVARMFNGGPWHTVATVPHPAYGDTAVSASTAYLYRVRAIGPGGVSVYSIPSLATTIVFSDDPIVAAQTLVRRAHLIELRSAVGAVCATAGLTEPTWTDSTIVAGVTPIRAAHILELRSNLTSAFANLGLPAPSFSNPVAAGALIRAADVQELRTMVR